MAEATAWARLGRGLRCRDLGTGLFLEHRAYFSGKCPRTEHGKARGQPVERGGSDNVVSSFAFYSIGTAMRTKK